MKLPKHWAHVPLATLCQKVEVVKRKERNPDEPFIYLDIGGIDNTTNRIESHKTYYWRDAPSRAQQIVRKGDILFSTVRTYLKNIALVDNDKFHDQIASSGFTVIRAGEAIIPKYLYYYSISDLFLRPLNELQTGSSYPAVRDKDVFAQPIPLPPIDEQERIVSKIEELFSGLDAGTESLRRAKTQIETYRQAVLKSAFEGKLANKTLIHDEASDGWELTKLGDLAELITKGASPKWQGINYVTDPNQVLFVTSENVRENFLDISTPKYIESEFNKKQKRSILQRDDVLLNIVGASIGRAAIFNLDTLANINQAVAVIRLVKNINPRFICYYLNSNRARDYYNSNKVDFARANLSLADVSSIPIAIPGPEEQGRIVNEIESRLSVCSKCDEIIAGSLIQAEILRQSILKKAFEGNLVEQDENDEPVQIMLARIEQVRQEIATEGKINQKTTSKVSRSKNMTEQLKSILQILRESSQPVRTYALWQASEYRDDIDKFYAEVKVLIEKGEIAEAPRTRKDSFLVAVTSK